MGKRKASVHAPSSGATSGRKRSRLSKALSHLPSGWECMDTVLIHVPDDAKNTKNVYAFDVEGTLVKTATGKRFPTERSDWVWKHKSIPDKLQELHKKGQVVFFCNQKGLSEGNYDVDTICGRFSDIAASLKIPVKVFVSAADDLFRKPNVGMWRLFADQYNGGVEPDAASCVFVGDAAGRVSGYGESKASHRDYSVKDRKFAHNIGVPFQTAEEFFLGEPEAPFEWRMWSPDDTKGLKKDSKDTTFSGSSIIGKGQELIVCVGPPASGATTFVTKHLGQSDYIIVDRGGKTPRACVQECRRALKGGHSVCMDATNPGADKRKPFIDLAKELGVPVRCFHFDTPIELAKHLNVFRYRRSKGKISKLPEVVFGVFNKHYEPPTKEEGFDEVCTVHFKPQLDSKQDKQLFEMFA